MSEVSLLFYVVRLDANCQSVSPPLLSTALFVAGSLNIHGIIIKLFNSKMSKLF